MRTDIAFHVCRSLAWLLLAGTAGCGRVQMAPHGGDAERALMTATTAGDTDAVKRLLASGADPNKMIEYLGHDNSPWYVALHDLRPDHPEQLEIIRAMLKAGADPDNAWGYSGLGRPDADMSSAHASSTGAVPPIRVVFGARRPVAEGIRAILEVKPTASGGETTLVEAVETDETEIARALIDAGVDVNTRQGAVSPLAAAIEQRNDALVTYLKQHGAKENP